MPRKMDFLKRKFFFSKDKFFLLGGILLFLLLLNFAASFEEEEITFIAFGHVYPDYDALNLSISLINAENPDFVVFLGDSLIEPFHEDWQVLKEIVSKIDAPIYFVPGNHDIPEDGSEEGYFLGEFSNSLFSDFKIKEKTFIILNSVTDKEGIYDISDEQAEFVKNIYEKNSGDKFIFVHHCLFYNYDNQFCNSREFFTQNNWNEKVVPIIQNRTIAVFVGDTGMNEPYFGYYENNLSYFGVGFSPKENQLKIPQHFLKVSLKNNRLEVTPIPIRQDLTNIKYVQRIDKTPFALFKAFIRKNLVGTLKLFTMALFLLFLIILFLLIKLRKLKRKYHL